MKIILIKDTAKLGQRGTLVEVSDSYAVNVLIPKGNAIQATPAELSKWKQKEDSKKLKKELETNTFLQLIQKLKTQKVIIEGKKADAKGQLFAGIHENDIVDAIYNPLHVIIAKKRVKKNSPKSSKTAPTCSSSRGWKVLKVITFISGNASIEMPGLLVSSGRR